MLLANVVKLFSKNIYFANKLFGKLECIYNILSHLIVIMMEYYT